MVAVPEFPENVIYLFVFKDAPFCFSFKVVHSLLKWQTSGVVETSKALELDKLGFQSSLE